MLSHMAEYPFVKWVWALNCAIWISILNFYRSSVFLLSLHHYQHITVSISTTTKWNLVPQLEDLTMIKIPWYFDCNFNLNLKCKICRAPTYCIFWSKVHVFWWFDMTHQLIALSSGSWMSSENHSQCKSTCWAKRTLFTFSITVLIYTLQINGSHVLKF